MINDNKHYKYKYLIQLQESRFNMQELLISCGKKNTIWSKTLTLGYKSIFNPIRDQI